MEKIKDIIEEKYFWIPQYKLALDWAELALDNGMDSVQVTSYIVQKIFSKTV